MMTGMGLWMGFGWLLMLAVISLPLAAVVVLAVAAAKSVQPRQEG